MFRTIEGGRRRNMADFVDASPEVPPRNASGQRWPDNSRRAALGNVATVPILEKPARKRRVDTRKAPADPADRVIRRERRAVAEALKWVVIPPSDSGVISSEVEAELDARHRELLAMIDEGLFDEKTLDYSAVPDDQLLIRLGLSGLDQQPPELPNAA